MNNKGADQTARRPICAFAVRIWHNRFSHDVAHLWLLSKLRIYLNTDSFLFYNAYIKPYFDHLVYYGIIR